MTIWDNRTSTLIECYEYYWVGGGFLKNILYMYVCLYRYIDIDIIYIPQEFNIDTKNDGWENCISFQTWLFWVSMLNFGGYAAAI